jgi:tRNA (cytidine/uridine-2'-O-)-methyltransferase
VDPHLLNTAKSFFSRYKNITIFNILPQTSVALAIPINGVVKLSGRSLCFGEGGGVLGCLRSLLFCYVGFFMPQIVLVNPLIPPNTGNIARTCAATGTALHLVGPLGFELSDRYLKRAGLDYWPHVNLTVHESIEAFHRVHQEIGGRLLGFTTKGRCSYIDCTYREDDWLLFGSETEGLPGDLLGQCAETVFLPMAQPAVRSLNLSVSVAVSLFEVKRQLGHWS